MNRQVSALFHSTLPFSGRNAQTQPMLAPGAFCCSAVLSQYFWHPLGHILPHEEPVLIQSWGALLQRLSFSDRSRMKAWKPVEVRPDHHQVPDWPWKPDKNAQLWLQVDTVHKMLFLWLQSWFNGSLQSLSFLYAESHLERLHVTPGQWFASAQILFLAFSVVLVVCPFGMQRSHFQKQNRISSFPGQGLALSPRDSCVGFAW